MIDFRRALKQVPTDDLLKETPSLATPRENPAFYRKMKAGLAMKNDTDAGEKPFKRTPFDVLQIVTKSPFRDDEIPRNFHQIVIKVLSAHWLNSPNVAWPDDSRNPCQLTAHADELFA